MRIIPRKLETPNCKTCPKQMGNISNESFEHEQASNSDQFNDEEQKWGAYTCKHKHDPFPLPTKQTKHVL